ncbi:hypothetical protein GCM10011414_16040 [Croceivirga lutea]|uniref:DUF4249 family protein n=1 Tax=Croceivirga lutea TaxID=1775167 RepID=UPI0016395F3E|nr:DUF4249 family protein [Croceivirga lutea]GGG47156.1 hypothetical protein GCM10011414_16040 [Croceivirga lutea]
MKKLVVYCCFCLLFFSCEDVIEVEIPEKEIRLIVDGIIKVDSSSEFVPVEIKVSESSEFFGENTPTQVENAVIFYGNQDPRTPELSQLSASNLAEKEPGSGIYVPDPNFSSDQRIRTSFLQPGMLFVLSLEYKGRAYAAQFNYRTSVPIDEFSQGSETLFDEDEVELEITITDGPQFDEYYVLDFGEGEFLTLSDEFFNGQEFSFSYFLDQDKEAGDQVAINITGADLEYYNFTNLIIEQTDSNGGVFQTPATTVRGNVFDVTGLDNIIITDNVERPNEFALGYFAVVQQFKDSLIVE